MTRKMYVDVLSSNAVNTAASICSAFLKVISTSYIHRWDARNVT